MDCHSLGSCQFDVLSMRALYVKKHESTNCTYFIYKQPNASKLWIFSHNVLFTLNIKGNRSKKINYKQKNYMIPWVFFNLKR